MVKQTLALLGLALSVSANAAVVEVGDLNIINDAGNASDGLRFLDMTYSDGFTLAGALTNAQVIYANARVATASEFDDLFDAAGIGYDGAETASAGFAVGGSITLSSGSNYDSGVLSRQLGVTDDASSTAIFTDPDGTSLSSSTRDYITVRANDLLAFNGTVGANNFPNPQLGWLIVSEVPLPAAAWLFISALGGLVVAKRKQLKAQSQRPSRYPPLSGYFFVCG